MGPWPFALYSLHAHVVPLYSNFILLQSHIDFVLIIYKLAINSNSFIYNLIVFYYDIY